MYHRAQDAAHRSLTISCKWSASNASSQSADDFWPPPDSMPFSIGGTANGSMFTVPRFEPLARYGDTLNQITMSGANTGEFDYHLLSHINLEKNYSLGYIDLRGIDLANWQDRIDAYQAMWTVWPPDTWSFSQPSGESQDINQNRFNFYQCASLIQSGSSFNSNKFTIRVRNAASKSLIDMYRGTTRGYPFRMMTWATVSYW